MAERDRRISIEGWLAGSRVEPLEAGGAARVEATPTTGARVLLERGRTPHGGSTGDVVSLSAWWRRRHRRDVLLAFVFGFIGGAILLWLVTRAA